MPRDRIAGLDLLRGIAVGLVILHHSFPPLSLTLDGSVGVVIFFTLSGYLITGLLQRDVVQFGRVRFGRFYRNRAFRLLPALFAFLICYTVWVFMAGPEQLRTDYPQNTAVALFYASDIPWMPVGYYLGHLWTLAVEEQFYLLWPFLLWWALRRNRGDLALLFAGFGIITGLVFSILVAPPAGIYVWPFSWSIALPIGAAAWLYQERIGAVLRRTRLRRITVPLAATAAIVVLCWVPNSGAWLRSYVICGPVTAIATAALLFTLREWKQLPTRWLRPVQALGIISYATYIWDYPISRFVHTYHVPGSNPLSIVLPLIAGTLSWFIVERPVAVLRRRLDARAAPVVSATMEPDAHPSP